MNRKAFGTLWLVVSVLLGIWSCSPNRRAKMKPAVPTISVHEVENVPAWPKPGKTNDGFFTSEIDSVKYILLETSPESMLGEISQIFRMGDSLMVVDAYVGHSVSVFDLEGKFCYRIGDVGRGPGEYVSLGYVHVSDNGLVYLSDSGSGKILVYTKEGEFVKEHRLKNSAPQTFFMWNDSVIIGGYSGYRLNAPYRLVWMDMEGNELETALPYMTGRQYVAGNFLKGEHSEILFSCPLNDTIFQVTAHSVTPYLSMGFYDKNVLDNFVEDTKNMNENAYLKELYRSDEITNLIDVFRCDNHWVTYSQKGRYTYVSVIDKNRRDYWRSDIKKKLIHIPDNFKTSWHDWVIGYVNPEALDYVDERQREAFLEKLSETCDSEITLDSLKQCNPVVTMYHLKNR